jgi:hypothetical protein
MSTRALLTFSAALSLAACGNEAPEPVRQQPIIPDPVIIPDPEKFERHELTEARVQFARLIDVETKIIARTCSPNPGVCHQTNNYPNMYTAGHFISMINARCNLEMPDPLQGWDGCEQRGDRLKLGELTSEIRWKDRHGPADWTFTLREPAEESATLRLELVDPEGVEIFAPPEDYLLTVEVTEGSDEAHVSSTLDAPYYLDLYDTIIASTHSGDLNRNGIYGAELSAGTGALIVPGSLEKSYLWGRITGSVPGTRMPLANQALSPAEYVAIACLIEGVDPDGEPSAFDEINYDDCEYALTLDSE